MGVGGIVGLQGTNLNSLSFNLLAPVNESLEHSRVLPTKRTIKLAANGREAKHAEEAEREINPFLYAGRFYWVSEIRPLLEPSGWNTGYVEVDLEECGPEM